MILAAGHPARLMSHVLHTIRTRLAESEMHEVVGRGTAAVDPPETIRGPGS